MGGTVFLLFCLTWGQTMVEVMNIMMTSFKSFHAGTAVLSAPNPAAGHCQLIPLMETHGHSWANLGQSLLGSLLLSSGSWCAQDSVCALQESVSLVLGKFWWLYGGVNGDLLQEVSCHTQVCCTRSPCPCSSPLLTCTSTGDIQTQFWLNLCGVSESWCAQGLFEPSGHLWQVWGLIPNVISPLLPSYWGFSIAFGHGVSFFGGIQHPPVNSCSAVSCILEVLAGEEMRTCFYSTIEYWKIKLSDIWYLKAPNQNEIYLI